MHWGMYVQADLTTMYVTIAAGLIAWLGLLLAATRLTDATSRSMNLSATRCKKVRFLEL